MIFGFNTAFSKHIMKRNTDQLFTPSKKGFLERVFTFSNKDAYGNSTDFDQSSNMIAPCLPCVELQKVDAKWDSLPSVVTWNCVRQPAQKITSGNGASELAEHSHQSENASCENIPIIINLSTSSICNEIEPFYAALHVEQQSFPDFDTNDYQKPSFGQKLRQASAYLGGAITRAFYMKGSERNGQSETELHTALIIAKKNLAESEERFMASESALICALLTAKDALDSAEEVRKKWGWLTFPSKIREIDSLKVKVSACKADLEALRTLFAEEHERLLDLVGTAEREYNAKKRTCVENISSRPGMNCTKISSSVQIDSFSFSTALSFLTPKSKSDQLTTSFQNFRGHPSVVTWYIPVSKTAVSCNLALHVESSLSKQPSAAKAKFSKVLSLVLGPYNNSTNLPPVSNEFRRLPSVVTWCAPRLVPKTERKPTSFGFRLSGITSLAVKSPTLSLFERITLRFSPKIAHLNHGGVQSTSSFTDYRRMPSVVSWYPVASRSINGIDCCSSHQQVSETKDDRKEFSCPCSSTLEAGEIESAIIATLVDSESNQSLSTPMLNVNSNFSDEKVDSAMGAGSSICYDDGRTSNLTALPSVVTWHMHKAYTPARTQNCSAVDATSSSFKPMFSNIFRQLSSSWTKIKQRSSSKVRRV